MLAAIHRFHVLGLTGQVQGESAGGGEAIERPAASGVARRREIIFALVQEDAGLLAVQQIGPQGEMFMRTVTDSGTSPDSVSVSSGSSSFVRTAASLRATMPRG